MKLSRIFIIPLLAGAIMSACDDGNSTIGGSLVTDKAEVIEDTTFTLSGRSIENPEIQSRTIVQLLGRLEAKGYGRLRSDIVTQFMPAARINFTDIKQVDVDSARLVLFMHPGAFTGDSLLPMGLDVYRLNKQLPSPIYSNFDPEGYYSKSDLMGKTIYTVNALSSDSLANLSFRSISIRLDDKFAQDLMNEYRDSTSQVFYSPETFAKWFPGVYIANSFGDGRVSQIAESTIYLHWKAHTTVKTDSTETDTIMNRMTACLSVTPEVITNNNLSYQLAPALLERINQGEALIAAPTGYDVELTFPLEKVLATLREKGGDMSVLNSLSMTLPVEELDTDYGIAPPTNVLLILKSKRQEFFAKNQIADNETSFPASYSTLTKSYSFTSMRGYIASMLDKKEPITPEDYTFVLTPINIETETVPNGYSTQVVTTAMTPFITSPALAKFNISDAKIKLIFSKQSINN